MLIQQTHTKKISLLQTPIQKLKFLIYSSPPKTHPSTLIANCFLQSFCTLILLALLPIAMKTVIYHYDIIILLTFIHVAAGKVAQGLV